MKYSFIILILFISFEIMAKQISELNWKKRLLVVSYKNEDEKIFNESKKFILDNKCQIEDRNLEILFFKNFKNKYFSTPDFIENKYGVWLIGYDGNIKDYTENDKIYLGLFDLIDSMPMRKNEMINNKC
ncbi:DUF4174 domain-containing protein [Pelagibacteraceae bacterium]|nr:DUF4174 domain-containing protein [Pelagibacteraceae bacterium]